MSNDHIADDVPLDFIIIDSRSGKPHRVKNWGGDYWIFWLHPDKRWVSLRKVTDSMELWRLQNACIEWKHHKLYEYGIPFEPEGWTSYDAPRNCKQSNAVRKAATFDHSGRHQDT